MFATFLFLAGLSLVLVPLPILALSGVKPSDAGVASAMLNVTQQIGGALGIALLNTLYTAAEATTAGQTMLSAHLAGYRIVFAVARAFSPQHSSPATPTGAEHDNRQEADQLIIDLRNRIDELLDHYRAALHDRLGDLSEQEARTRLVPSNTTLLGLVKHAIYLERFYFDHAVTGRPYEQIGIASTPDRSFTLAKSDTIATVQRAHRHQCEQSRATMAQLSLDTVVEGRGPYPVWALQLQVLRELAHHAGHGDILREQIIAKRSS